MAKVSGKAKRVLVLPDAHYPHVDEAAMGCVFHAIEIWNPDEVVILGDWLDAAAFSQHGKRSFVETEGADYLETEVGPCNSALDRIQGPKDRPTVFLEGNHCNRIERAALAMGGDLGRALYKLASPERVLRHRVNKDGEPGVKRKNFRWVPYLTSWEHSHHKIAKDLIAVHGWSIAKNAAKVHLDLVRSCSIVHGHTHRAQSYTGRDPLSNKLLHAWSPGCLSKLVPIYMATQPSDWSHGFSMVYIGEKSWTKYDVPISRGECVLPGGELVKC